MISQRGFLELKRLVRNLKCLPVKHGVDATLRIVDLHRHGFAVPRMAANELPRTGRPSLIDRLLTSMRRSFLGFAGALRGMAASTSDFCSEVSSCARRRETPSAPPQSRVRLVMIHRSAYPRPARLLP